MMSLAKSSRGIFVVYPPWDDRIPRRRTLTSISDPRGSHLGLARSPEKVGGRDTGEGESSQSLMLITFSSYLIARGDTRTRESIQKIDT